MWRWGFWLRLRSDRGIAVVNHRQYPALFSEREKRSRNKFLHIGRWCFRLLAARPGYSNTAVQDEVQE